MQAGSVAFDLFLIPFRLSALLLVVTLTFGLDFKLRGVLPAVLLMVVFVPFVWGLGLVTAAAILMFRRGGGVLGAMMATLGLVSGAFFPLALLPLWLQRVAEANPVAIVMEGTREPLIGGPDWGAVVGRLDLVPLALVPCSRVLPAFRAALAREHRQGTLGLDRRPLSSVAAARSSRGVTTPSARD